MLPSMKLSLLDVGAGHDELLDPTGSVPRQVLGLGLLDPLLNGLCDQVCPAPAI